MAEYGRVCKKGKVALLLREGVEGFSDSVEEVANVLYFG